MAAWNWQAIDGGNDGNLYRIVYHIPIPSANNAVGVNYQTAVVNSGIGGKTILATGTGPGQITAADLALIQAGSLYEYVEQFQTNPGQNLASLAAAVTAKFTALSTSIIAQLQNQLKYYGGTG